MPHATIFAVTDDVFAMKTAAGVVLVASAGPDWQPKVGTTLTGYRHQLGECIATDVETGQSVALDIKSCSDIARPSTWIEML